MDVKNVENIAESFCLANGLPPPRYKPGEGFWTIFFEFPVARVSVYLEWKDSNFDVMAHYPDGTEQDVNRMDLGYASRSESKKAQRLMNRQVKVSSVNEIRVRFSQVLQLIAPYFLGQREKSDWPYDSESFGNRSLPKLPLTS